MKTFSTILLIMIALACGSTKNTVLMESTPGPHALVYKTKADYFDKVPILLSEDKKQIISYPSPSDLRQGEQMALPSKLIRGYLLDNRGIGKNVAFLTLTYSEYAKLKEAPSIAELEAAILDDDPLKELWDCGRKTNFSELSDFKKLIRSGFAGYQKIK